MVSPQNFLVLPRSDAALSVNRSTYQRSTTMKSICLSLLLTCSFLVSKVAAQQSPEISLANKDRKLPTSLELAKERVAKDPKDADAHYRLAVAYRREQQTLEAVPHIFEAIKLIPNIGKHHAEKGLLLFLTQGDLSFKPSQEIVAEFEKAISLEPQNADLWVMYGDFFSSLNEPTSALPKYEQALSLNPNHTAALHGNGMIHFQQRKWDIAKDSLQKACDLDLRYEAQTKEKGEKFQRYINQDSLSDLPASYLSHFQRIDVTLSLARIYERQGDQAKRDQYLEKLYTIHRNAGDSIDSFVRDEFDVGAYHVVASEYYDLTTANPSRLVFEATKDGKATNDFRVIAIALHQSPSSPPANRYHFQRVRHGLLTHTTTYKVFDTLPSYQEAKALLLDTLQDKAQPLPTEQTSAAK